MASHFSDAHLQRVRRMGVMQNDGAVVFFNDHDEIPGTFEKIMQTIIGLVPKALVAGLPAAKLQADYPLISFTGTQGATATSQDEIVYIDTLYRMYRQMRLLRYAASSPFFTAWTSRHTPGRKLIEDADLLARLDQVRATALGDNGMPTDSDKFEYEIMASGVDRGRDGGWMLEVPDPSAVTTLHLEEFRRTTFVIPSSDVKMTNRTPTFDARGQGHTLWRVLSSEDTLWNKPLMREFGKVSNVIRVDSGGVGDCFFQAMAFAINTFAPEMWTQYRSVLDIPDGVQIDHTLLLRALVFRKYQDEISNYEDDFRNAFLAAVEHTHDAAFTRDMMDIVRRVTVKVPEPVYPWSRILQNGGTYKQWISRRMKFADVSRLGDISNQTPIYIENVHKLTDFVQQMMEVAALQFGWIEIAHWSIAAAATNTCISIWGKYTNAPNDEFYYLSKITGPRAASLNVRIFLNGIREGGVHYVNIINRTELPDHISDKIGSDLTDRAFVINMQGQTWVPSWKFDGDFDFSQMAAHFFRYGCFGRGGVLFGLGGSSMSGFALARLNAVRNRIQRLPEPEIWDHRERFIAHSICIAATDVVMRSPTAAAMFAGFFCTLLRHRIAHNTPSLLDRVYYVHKLVREMVVNNSAFYVRYVKHGDPPAQGTAGAVVLPRILGFSRESQQMLPVDKFRTDGAFVRVGVHVNGASSNLIKNLSDLIVSTAALVYSAMQVAATLIGAFMTVTTDAVALRDHWTAANVAVFLDTLSTRFGLTSQTDGTLRRGAVSTFGLMHGRASVRMLPLLEGNFKLALLVCRSYLHFMPQHFTNTAFFEFASEWMASMVTDKPGNDELANQTLRNTLASAPTNSALHHPGTDMRFTGAGGAAEASFTLRVVFGGVHETEWSRQHISQREVRLVAWLTRSVAAQMAVFSAPRDESFGRFLQHTQIASAVAHVTADAATADLVFTLRPADMVAAQREAPVYVHVAAYALETSPEEPRQRLWVRNGHGLINIASIAGVDTPFTMTLWEGPISTAIAWSDAHDVTTDMSYKRTYTLTATISTTNHALFTSGATAPLVKDDRQPASLFSAEEKRVLVRYIAGVVARIPAAAQRQHSLLYVNFPQQGTVVPNWASLLLPPIATSAWMLEDRVAAKLFDEGISAAEFAAITRLAETRDAPLQRYARDRFLWIVVQILTPYNKVCYRLDRIDGKGNDQMGYPFANTGDCEDTAQAVVQLVRGFSSVSTTDPAAQIVVDFLQRHEPAMCVLTTQGPTLTRGTQGPKGLHMMAALIPRDRTAPIVPLETTGLSYNSFASPDYLLGGNAPQQIIRRTKGYAAVCAAANAASAAVRNEFINYAVLAEAGSATPPARHHFYSEFIMAMMPDPDLGFYDFKDGARVGVPFYRAVVDGVWTLQRVDEDSTELREALPLVRRFVNNVQPTPSFATLKPSEPAAPVQRLALAPSPDAAALLAPRSVSFFINTDILSNARSEIDALYDALKVAKLPQAAEVMPPDLVAVLGGAITYYVVRVRLA